MKYVLLFIVSVLLFACHEQTTHYDSHTLQQNKDRIISEKWERGPVRFIGNYDTSGNILSLKIRDDNLQIIVNMKSNQIHGYSIQSRHYRRVANIEPTGRLLSALERSGKERIQYVREKGRLKIKVNPDKYFPALQRTPAAGE